MYSKDNGFFRPPVLASFSIENTTAKPLFDQDLPSTVYQPFLEQLFNWLALDFPENQFILTGSAAKQLQDPTLPNPNDLDFLMGNEDLIQGLSQIRAVLKKMAVEFTFDDASGTLVVVHDAYAIKIQVIDTYNSHHCYPPREKLKDLCTNGSIRMLSAAVIPVVETSNEPIIGWDGNLIEVNEIDLSDNDDLDLDGNEEIINEMVFPHFSK
ncbi:hypothetical protein ACD661_06025 [Legionella lytica]|uniref:Uncharacterized protein n=1 Tax=Legionella lytica TaxID=96232 RepID=A0ABW8D8E1_9GAMM